MSEAGIPPLQYVVIEYRRFMLTQRGQGNRDTPFDFVYNICREGNTPGYRFKEHSMLRNSEEGLERIERFVREKAPGATKL